MIRDQSFVLIELAMPLIYLSRSSQAGVNATHLDLRSKHFVAVSAITICVFALGLGLKLYKGG